MKKNEKIVLQAIVIFFIYCNAVYPADTGGDARKPPVAGQRPIAQGIPSSPKYAASPNGNVPAGTSGIPVMKNIEGRIIDVGLEKDGGPWMDIRDNLSGDIIRIKIKDLKNTPVVRQTRIYRFSDIKTGDMVSAIFREEGDDNIAYFINVTTLPIENSTQPQKQ